MEKQTYISDLQDGMTFNDIFALASARMNQAKNGPYWLLTLQDKSGTQEARIWFPASQNYTGLAAEQFVRVQGRISTFKDQLQATITTLQVLDPAGIDRSLFLPCSASPPQNLLEEIETILKKEVVYPGWKKFYTTILKDQDIRQSLLTAPGGKSIHHAYMGGLLEHTLGVLKACLAISQLYPSLDRDILLVAAAFHDLGKAYEISHGLSREYTAPGKLLGHIHLGLEVLTPFLAASDLDKGLILHFKHLILSHHGQYDYGSPKLPMTQEAMVLHLADNLDAKMNTMSEALENTETGQWSGYQRCLERDLYAPSRTPHQPKTTRTSPKKKEGQCSLPLKV